MAVRSAAPTAPRLLAERAGHLLLLGARDAAVAACLAAEALAAVVGDTAVAGDLLATRALALVQLGRLGEAAELVEVLLHASAAAGAGAGAGAGGPARARSLAVAGHLADARGATDEAVARFAEAQHELLRAAPQSGPGHDPGRQGSAVLALATGLAGLGLHAEADDLLRPLTGGARPPVALLVEEQRLLTVWATAEQAAGDPAAARARYRTKLERLGALRRSPAAAGVELHGRVHEAFARQRLGEADAGVRLVAGADPDTLDPGCLERSMFEMVLSRAAEHAGDLERAEVHLDRALAGAAVAGSEVLTDRLTMVRARLVDAREGCTAGSRAWRDLALSLLERRVRSRARLTAGLADRLRLHRLTDEARLIGEAASRDALTGLANRRVLEQRLELAGPVTALFVDVDRFKSINDGFSHVVGDRVLCALAGLLRAACREEDVVARYGGDEFVVLTAAGADDARRLAERVRSGVADHPWERTATGLAVTVSIGVAAAGSARAALELADDGLRLAKRSGRDRTESGDPLPAVQPADRLAGQLTGQRAAVPAG